jgi:hypothetical protein
MKKLKNLLLKKPEFLLLTVVVIYWVSAGVLLNPIAIGLVAVLLFQILKHNRDLGLLMSILFILISFFTLLALLSELSEFPAFNADAREMLLVGLLLLFPSLIASGLMFYKYSR